MKSIKTTVTLWLLCLFTVAPACMKTGAKLILRDNAKLIVNMDGVLKGANIISQSSGQIQVEDGGQIIRPTNGEFKVEAGSSFILTEGSIQ